MSIITFILLLPVLIGLICLKAGDRTIKKILFLSLLCQICMVIMAVIKRPDNLMLVKFTEDIRFVFGVDNLSVLFLILFSVIWFVVAIYAFQYMEHEENRPRYYMFYMFTLSALMGLSLSKNLVTMYFCYEMMTLMSVPLVFHTQTKEALKAGMKYLGYSIFGAGFGLMGIFYINFYAKTTDFAANGIFRAVLLDGNVKNILLIIYFLMMIGFGCKAGMFPLHSWLPAAHPIAPSPASAVLSGIITKGGVLAIIRVTYYIFGKDFLKNTWAIETCTMLAIFTIFMGSMLAFKEKILKKRLAYSTISQVSYVLFALFSMSKIAFTGAMLQITFHAIAKNLLFLSAGTMIYLTGCKNVDELSGVGKKTPITMMMFTIGSLSLIGIPPLGGFISKWYIGNGVLGSVVGFVGVIVLMISALLTAGYTLPIMINGCFSNSTCSNENIKEESSIKIMSLSMGILALLLIGMSLYPDFAISFFKNISSSLFF